jgi:chromosome segregation ATPase
VEEESFPGQFRKLEDKIEDLIQTCRHLQQTESELEAKIYELEGALKAKVAAEQEYAKERSMVRSKVDDLLSRLDRVLGSK